LGLGEFFAHCVLFIGWSLIGTRTYNHNWLRIARAKVKLF
jgi:hypothetical protein